MTNSTFTSNLYEAIRLVKSRLTASEVKILQNGGEVRRNYYSETYYSKDYYWQVSLYDQAHLKIEKSSIEHGEHGGIYAESSEVEIADCIVAHHQSNGLEVTNSSTAKVVGGTFRANLNDQIAGYNNSTLEVRDAVLDGKGISRGGLSMWNGHVAIKKCQIHSHTYRGVWVRGGSGCTIEDSQLENNGPEGLVLFFRYSQLFVNEAEKVALSDLRVIGGKGGGVYLESCKASFVSKSIIRGNQGPGLWARRTQLTVEKTEFQDNGKPDTSFGYSYSYNQYMQRYMQIPYCYQILAEEVSCVQLKEVQIYEGRHGGILVRNHSTVTLRGGSIHGHGREAIAVQNIGGISKIVVIGARIFGNAQQTDAKVIVKYRGTNAQQTVAQVIVNGGTVEMEDACIQDSPHGGALVENVGTLILKRCQVHNNRAYNLRSDWYGRVEFIDMPPVED